MTDTRMITKEQLAAALFNHWGETRMSGAERVSDAVFDSLPDSVVHFTTEEDVDYALPPADYHAPRTEVVRSVHRALGERMAILALPEQPALDVERLARALSVAFEGMPPGWDSKPPEGYEDRAKQAFASWAKRTAAAYAKVKERTG
jgi:hypothetical protein